MPFLLFLAPIWKFVKAIASKVPLWAWAILILGGALWIEHARLQSSQREIQTTRTELRSAADANRSNVTTIAALRVSLADLTKSLDQERHDAEVAAAKASQRDQALQAQLVADKKALDDLRSDPRYAPFLNLDIAAQYPDIAQRLRVADDPGQD